MSGSDPDRGHLLIAKSKRGSAAAALLVLCQPPLSSSRPNISAPSSWAVS
jgi:hypothetical protein